MKKMTFQEINIISLTEKKARIIEFDSNLTVLSSQRPDGTSLNRTGKSLVLKSIYFALGADLSKYTANWSELNICTILRFKLDSNNYIIFRQGNSFIVINIDTSVTYKFYSIKELKEFYVEFFDFNIKLMLLNSKDETQTSHLYPGGVFMPYYIDQDLGWQGEWRSFNDTRYYKDWVKEILYFHTGIKTKEYYKLLEEQAKYSDISKVYKMKLKTLEAIFEEQIARNKEVLDINICISDFKDEIDQLTMVLNKHLIIKNKVKDELVSLYNEQFEIEETYNNARIVLSELEKDIQYLNQHIMEEALVCPTCGSIHENSPNNRFLIYSEKEKCENIINEYYIRYEDNKEKILEVEQKLCIVEREIENVNEILSVKRNEVTFDDVIKSQGAKEILNSLSTDLEKLTQDIEKVDGVLKRITQEKSQIMKDAKEKRNIYSEQLNLLLRLLDVTDIDLNSPKKIGQKLKCSGSDLARAVLAQHFACYLMASRYTSSVLCPLVIDTPLQQDPGSEKIELVLDFLIERQPKDSQIILATTETHAKEFNGKIIYLLDNRELLKDTDYDKVNEEMSSYIRMLAL